MADFVNPIWAPLIGLLLVAAIVVGAWRMAGRGPSRMRRAMFTVGGTLVAVWLLGILLQACTAPASQSNHGSVSNH